ncbi:MAG: outer membrane protein OmpA/MotB family [Bryobacterales bacterium]|nr:outer membrane protein OmpA/MotB family [Bryobacterales bacterium]
MKYLPGRNQFRRLLAVSAQTLMTATLVLAVTPNTKTFTAGEKANVKGVIISHEGDSLKVRGDDDSVETVDLTGDTKIQLKHGMFGRKSKMENSALVPGLRVEAQGKGNEKGDLVADRVIFDPSSMKASRQIDTRVSPLEARQGSLEGKQGQLEGRTGTLENRAGQIEGKQGDLEKTQQQTIADVGKVRSTAEQANQGVTDVNGRVTNLDNYQPKETATVYFKINSAALSPDAKKDLDDLAQKALNEKGYLVEIAGFADTTGNAAVNQELSQRRANAVIHYLEQNGNIPIHRILTPSGLGTSHEAADNKTSEGRKLNRRVEVKVLVNQGLASATGGSQAAAPTATTTGTTAPPQQ